MNKKYLAVIVLAAAVVGLVYSIERTARPPLARPPGAVAGAAGGAPTAMPTVPVTGHEGHNH
jgi:hypothetical protein